MNETQFKLVKTFLDGFKIPPKKLAKAWSLDLMDVIQAHYSPNFEVYQTMPEEDLHLFMKEMAR